MDFLTGRGPGLDMVDPFSPLIGRAFRLGGADMAGVREDAYILHNNII